MRSRTQNDIYISTNDFARGIPIFLHLMVPFQRYLQIILNRCVLVPSTYKFKGFVSTVSTILQDDTILTLFENYSGLMNIFRVRINKQIITGNLTKLLLVDH